MQLKTKSNQMLKKKNMNTNGVLCFITGNVKFAKKHLDYNRLAIVSVVFSPDLI